jgi:hypothetical protein
MTELSVETVRFFEEKNLSLAGSQTTISRLQFFLLRVWAFFSGGQSGQRVKLATEINKV